MTTLLPHDNLGPCGCAAGTLATWPCAGGELAEGPEKVAEDVLGEAKWNRISFEDEL